MTFLTLTAWVAASVMLAGAGTAGVMILTTSGPLANDDNDNDSAETATAGATAPVETPTAPPSESHLADLVAEGVDTSDWEVVAPEGARLMTRAPDGFELRTERWEEYMGGLEPVPVEIWLVRRLDPDATPPPPGGGPEDGMIVFEAIILPNVLPFGDPLDNSGTIETDAAQIEVLGAPLALRQFRYPDGQVAVMAYGNIRLSDGRYVHISGLVGGASDDDLRLIVGLLTSTEVAP